MEAEDDLLPYRARMSRMLRLAFAKFKPDRDHQESRQKVRRFHHEREAYEQSKAKYTYSTASDATNVLDMKSLAPNELKH